MSTTAERAATGTRDAERSREALLGAAEETFAERGFSGASLGEIAAVAGLSRGAPNYFFGSKEELYVATLERVFADREAAARDACLPLHRWAEGTGRGVPPLEQPMRKAVAGYLEFLLDRPSFVALLLREELDGGSRLRDARRESQAIEDAFAAVRAAKRRGLKPFDTRQAVLVFVSLTFSPVAQRATFMAALEIDLTDPAARRRHVKLAVDQLLHLTGA